MGRKVHPIGLRLAINKTWEGRWYAEGEQFVDQLHQDFAVRELIRERFGVRPWHVEGTDGSRTWVLIDYVDVVVHLFSRQFRHYYDLELIWGEAPRVRWRRPAAYRFAGPNPIRRLPFVDPALHPKESLTPAVFHPCRFVAPPLKLLRGLLRYISIS